MLSSTFMFVLNCLFLSILTLFEGEDFLQMFGSSGWKIISILLLELKIGFLKRLFGYVLAKVVSLCRYRLGTTKKSENCPITCLRLHGKSFLVSIISPEVSFQNHWNLSRVFPKGFTTTVKTRTLRCVPMFLKVLVEMIRKSIESLTFQEIILTGLVL